VSKAELPLFTRRDPPRPPVEDSHRESARATRHGAADASAATDESKGLAPDERSFEVDRLRSRKNAGAHQAITLDHPAGYGKQEPEMQVGCRFGDDRR